MPDNTRVEGSGDGWRVEITVKALDGGFVAEPSIQIRDGIPRRVSPSGLCISIPVSQLAGVHNILSWCVLREITAGSRLRRKIQQIHKWAKSEIRRMERC